MIQSSMNIWQKKIKKISGIKRLIFYVNLVYFVITKIFMFRLKIVIVILIGVLYVDKFSGFKKSTHCYKYAYQ